MYTQDDSLERAYADKKAWTHFEGQDESETVGVYRRCPHCSRYLKKGNLFMNMLGEIRLTGWTCAVHGDVLPYYDRDC